MPNLKYSMSFTSGALLHRESIVIAELRAELGDWDAVRNKVIAENLLRMRTMNASKRICREVTSRLKQLTANQIEMLQIGSRQEQGYLLWLAICKRYRFIYDFAVEVVREHYLRLNLDLTYADYDAFFRARAEWHPEVEHVAAGTRNKQRQIVFLMLREADLLTRDQRIIPALLTPRLVDAIRADDPTHFATFPVSEIDIQRWTR
jgi:hypothetical protein